MQTYQLPDYFETTEDQNEVIMRYYRSDHKSLKNKIILNRNMISFIIDGNKTVDHPEKSVDVKAGELVILSKGNILTSEMTSELNDFRSLIIYFSNEVLNRFWIKYEYLLSDSLSTSSTPYLIYKQDEFISSYINSVLLLLQKTSTLTAEIKQIKLEELLLYLLQSDSTKLRSLRILSEDQNSLHLKAVVERFVEQPTTVDELAFLCNMSHSTFQRKFKHLYGSSPQKWLLNKRMKLSAELLRASDATPSQIYFKVGYENHSSFSEAFRKHFGLTPSQYRKQYMTVLK